MNKLLSSPMKTIEAVAVILAIGLAVTVTFSIGQYQILNQNYSELNQKFNNLEKLFWNNYPLLAPSFISPTPQQQPTQPPVSKAQALQIAQGANWTSSLENVTITLNLVCFWTEYSIGGWTGYGSSILFEVTNPVVNYSAIQVGGLTFRYLWIIDLLPAGHIGGFPTYVDAATGEIIPTGPLY